MEFYYNDLVCVFRFELFTFIFVECCFSVRLWNLDTTSKCGDCFSNEIFCTSITGHSILKESVFSMWFTVGVRDVIKFLYVIERLFIQRNDRFCLANEFTSCLNVVVDFCRFLSLEFSLVGVSFEDTGEVGKPKAMRIKLDFGVRLIRDLYVEDVCSLDTWINLGVRVPMESVSSYRSWLNKIFYEFDTFYERERW